MLNAGPGNDPMTDLLLHKLHPFPEEIESLIWDIHKIKPVALQRLRVEPFEWEEGINISAGVNLLQSMLAELQAGS